MSVQQPELGEVTEAVARPNWCDWKSRQFDARSTCTFEDFRRNFLVKYSC